MSLVVFNPYSGVVGSTGPNVLSYNVQSAGLWWRISVGFASGGATTAAIQFYPSYNNTGTQTEWSSLGAQAVQTIDGIQLEALYQASSYIPTFASTTTRSADNITNSSISWYNQSQGTIIIEAIPYTFSNTQYPGWVAFDDGSANNMLGIYNAGGGASSLQNQIRVASSIVGYVVTPISLAQSVTKVGMTYTNTATTISSNGGNYVSASSSAVPTVNEMVLGAGGAFSPNNFWIRSLAYYKTPMTQAQLNSLTGQL